MNSILLQLRSLQESFPGLWDFSLVAAKSSAIILLAWSLTAFLRNHSARARNWVWRFCLAGLLGLALWTWLPHPWQEVVIRIETPPANTSEGALPAINTREVTADPSLMTETEFVTIESGRLLAWLGLIDGMLLPAWIGSSLFLAGLYLIRLLAGNVWLSRHSQPSGHSEVSISGIPVMKTPGLGSPLLAGWLKPKVYLPEEAESWPAHHVRCVLLHEQAHGQRNDLAWQVLGYFVACLWWWNPLAWMALGRLKSEAEHAADDLVLLQGSRQEDYARLLVRMASLPKPAAHGGLPMAGHTPIEHRIRNIIQTNMMRDTINRTSVVLLAIFSLVVFLAGTTNLVMAQVDLTGYHGEIVHNQMDPDGNVFARGDFHANQGSAQGWEGALDKVSSQGRAIRVSADDEPVVVETTVQRGKDWKWVNLYTRMRPAPGHFPDANQQALVCLVQENDSGKQTAPRLEITEDRGKGYTNWAGRYRTIRLAPETTQLKIQIQLTPGAGQLDISEIFIVPSDPDKELDHRLVDQFMDAVSSNDLKTVQAMLEKEPRLVESRNGQCDNGTPLIVCAWKELPEMAQLLIDHGASIEAKDTSWKSTALAWCGWWGTPRTAQVLLNAGANPKFQSRYGVSPLSSARAGKNSNGARFSSPETYDKTIALFEKASKS